MKNTHMNLRINGYETLKEWQNEHGELPETWQSITGRGGYHLFYFDIEPHKNRVGLYEGVDIRGEGGYIIAPPSVHANGHRYEWEQWREDGVNVARVDGLVRKFINGPEPQREESQNFHEPEKIPSGKRVSSLIRLVGSLKAKGLENDSIMAAVKAENEAKCIPPLSDHELTKEVFPALKRGWKTERSYTTTTEHGKVTPKAVHSLDMLSINDVEEKTPEWLISGYIPRHQITVMAGDGGAGKTTAWCDIAGSVSSGRPCFLERAIPEDFAVREPGKVLFFSSEDSPEYTLKSRLIKAGANLKNIFTTTKKDREFVSESVYNVKQAPAKEAAKEFIIESLQEGQKEASELNELAQILGISKSAMREAKAELKKEQIIKMKSAGFGAEKKWYISLVEGAHIPSEKTNR